MVTADACLGFGRPRATIEMRALAHSRAFASGRFARHSVTHPFLRGALSRAPCDQLQVQSSTSVLIQSAARNSSRTAAARASSVRPLAPRLGAAHAAAGHRRVRRCRLAEIGRVAMALLEWCLRHRRAAAGDDERLPDWRCRRRTRRRTPDGARYDGSRWHLLFSTTELEGHSAIVETNCSGGAVTRDAARQFRSRGSSRSLRMWWHFYSACGEYGQLRTRDLVGKSIEISGGCVGDFLS